MTPITITLDDQPIELPRLPISRRAVPLTGHALKQLAGLAPDLALFITGLGEDRPVPDETPMAFEAGDRLFSLPAVVYGSDQKPHQVIVHINRTMYRLENPVQTGRALKLLANIPLEDVLFLDRHPEDLVVGNDSVVTLRNGEHLHSQVPATYGAPARIRIHIDQNLFTIDSPIQTGLSLKQLAGLDPAAVLFLTAPHEDVLIANDASITLRPGSRLHSQIPAEYGLSTLALDGRPRETFQEHPQADGWLFLVLHDVQLPADYTPDRVRILIKLPPLFPDAAPDMFWVAPEVRLRNGGAPQSTSTEQALGETWQRFSWHLAPGAWRVGVSTLQDYIRCIRARFARGN